jgi:hypothetical protein
MRRSVLAGAILGAAVTAMSSACANAQTFHTEFSGNNELGPLNAETGAIFSPGQATLALKLDQKLQSLTYTLTYSNLSAAVLQAHIHFGKVHVPGGIMVFFCTNLGNGPAGTPACPNPSGTVTGTLTPTSVIAVPGQNIPAGSFDALTNALLSESAYGNIHTENFKAGEIRGEIRQDRQGE